MSDIIKQLALQLFLILLNAFFAATEIAVISLNEKKIKARAEDGDKKAGRMLKMIEEPTRFLSTIQIGITIAGFLGSAFAADNFAERLSDSIINTFGVSPEGAGAVNTLSVIVITLILSFFTLVLGELVPKRVAMRHKEKLAELVCGVISGLAVALKPAIWLLTVSTNGVLRLIGIDPHAKDEPVSEEDIVLMLDAGADEGTLKQDDIEYIKNVFKLDRLSAEDVMTPRKNIVSVSVDADSAQIVKTIETEGFSRIPVTGDDGKEIVGILHARDYFLKKDTAGFELRDILRQPVFVPESVHLDVLFRDMQKDHNHMVIVADEYGSTAGIVTMEDIIEEIVGEIWDERDREIDEFSMIAPGLYRVLCSASISDFCEFFSLAHEPETDASTVNGWLTEQCGRIPDEGDVFSYENLTLKVTKSDGIMANEAAVRVNDTAEKSAELQR